MEQLGKHVSEDAHILFGTAVDPKMGPRMSVTILSSVGFGATSPVILPAHANVHVVESAANEEVAEDVQKADAPQLIETVDETPAPVPPPKRERPKIVAPKPSKAAPELISSASEAKAKAEAKQETLQFESITRGRFEKSEPTIVDGQDLDVPTFLRRNVKV